MKSYVWIAIFLIVGGLLSFAVKGVVARDRLMGMEIEPYARFSSRGEASVLIYKIYNGESGILPAAVGTPIRGFYIMYCPSRSSFPAEISSIKALPRPEDLSVVWRDIDSFKLCFGDIVVAEYNRGCWTRY